MPTEKHAAKTILIVEDDDSIGEFLRMIISLETPYYPIVVADGAQALHVLTDLKPDLLLLDYRLPEMTGIELYDRIRASEGLTAVPTIMTSAGDLNAQIGDRKVTVLHKPFEVDELLEIIDTILAKENQ